MNRVKDVLLLFETRGNSMYGGESVTQLEHALQAALLAEDEAAPAALIVAALLHDIGHLLHELPDSSPDHGIDDRHELSGADFLQAAMPESVTRPISLHVPAKRYLCAVDREYHRTLSRPSVVSLGLQGGPMTASEVEAFRKDPFAQDAVRLRRWDDEAKVPSLPTPPLSHFVDYVSQVALETDAGP